MASGGGGTNPRELQENLSNSEAQLHQVCYSEGVAHSLDELFNEGGGRFD